MLRNIEHLVDNQFGSKRGLLRWAKYHCFQQFGYMRSLRGIDFSRVRRVVFICSGNLCRSAIAHHYARHIGLEADSYGLDCRGGDPADRRALAFADDKGFDLSAHQSKHISDYRAQAGDLLVAMEPRHVTRMQSFVVSGVPITLAGLWAKRPCLYIHDPYSANDNYFGICGNRVVETVDLLFEKIRV